MKRTLNESIDATMSELFRMHDYRGMYDYYCKFIRPELAKFEEVKSQNSKEPLPEARCRRIEKFPSCPKVPNKFACKDVCNSWF